MSARDRALARGLGNAFLAGPWARADMFERATTVIGARPRWLRQLVSAVLTAYPHPPTDRPRELADFVAARSPFQTAVDAAWARGKPLSAKRIPPAPTEMARSPWKTPPLNDEAALAEYLGLDIAELLWFADVRGLQRRAAPGPLHHYRYLWKASSRPRLLEAPKPRLRQAQRTLLDGILALVPVHPAVHGFVPGRSALTGARAHAGSGVVLTLDLESFFSSLDAGRVYGVFRGGGYPQPVAHLLTGLCTTRTPVRILAKMPAVGEIDARFRQRRLLADAHLPQGAPTSPALANLCVMRLDRRLAGYARVAGLTYTRYADDLVLSGPSHLRTDSLIAAVSMIVGEEGLRLQTSKTRVQQQSQRQTVTGIVVNERPNLPRNEFDALKALLHNASRFGPASQNRSGHLDFRAHLLGRIGWVEQLNPDRGRRLRALFDTITW